MKTTQRLVNRKAVRDFALAAVERERPHRSGEVTRVSNELYAEAEASVRNVVLRHVRNHHVGKTLGKGN